MVYLFRFVERKWCFDISVLFAGFHHDLTIDLVAIKVNYALPDPLETDNSCLGDEASCTSALPDPVVNALSFNVIQCTNTSTSCRYLNSARFL